MTTQPMPCGRLLSARLLDALAIVALPVAVIVCFVLASVTTDNGPRVVAPYPGQHSHAAVKPMPPARVNNSSEK